MGPPQTQGAPVLPKMGVRARVSNWSKKQDVGDVQPPPRVDSLAPSMLDEPSKDLQTGLQDSRRTLVGMKRSNSELTISDFGSEDVDPNTRAALTRGYGSSSSLDLLSSAGFMEVLRVDQEPSAPPPITEPLHRPAVLSPSLQAAVQIASGDMVLVPGGSCVETSAYRRKAETSVLSRLRPQRTNRKEDGSALTPHRCFSHHDVQSVLFTVAESQPGLLWSSSEAPDLLPSVRHEEVNADGLVLVCPQRNPDLTQFCQAAGTSCSSAAVSILEASSETQPCSANLGTYEVEHWDLGAKYYQKYFYNKGKTVTDLLRG